jgi:hypothetical protein
VAWTYEFGRSVARGCGIAITDDAGSAEVDDFRVAIAGVGGIAAAGECGVAFARNKGKVKAGNGGVLLLRWHQDEIKVVRVGENGIKPDTWYKLDQHGAFIECPPPDTEEGYPF